MKKAIMLTAAVLMLTTAAMADVTLCLYGGVYRCYETDLTCADITIGVIIQECEDMIIAPGGGGGATGGVITQLHPELDGQGIAGPGTGFGTAVPVGADGRTIIDVTLIFENRDTFSPGRRMQAVGRTSEGFLYFAEFDVDFLDPDSDGDTLIYSTAGGDEILGGFDLQPTGVTATGNATVTVELLDPTPTKAAVSVHHTPINFADLNWTYLSNGPVGNETLSWGAVKASY